MLSLQEQFGEALDCEQALTDRRIFLYTKPPFVLANRGFVVKMLRVMPSQQTFEKILLRMYTFHWYCFAQTVKRKAGMRKTLLMVSAVVLVRVFDVSSRGDAAEFFDTNGRVVSVVIPKKPLEWFRTPLSLGGQRATQSEKTNKVFTLPIIPADFFQRFEIKEMVRRLEDSTQDPFPYLYYRHTDERVGSRFEGLDIFGRRWTLSPRMEGIFPLCRWDSPSRGRERVLIGVGLSVRF